MCFCKQPKKFLGSYLVGLVPSIFKIHSSNMHVTNYCQYCILLLCRTPPGSVILHIILLLVGLMMINLHLKLMITSLLATASAVTLDPCSSEATARPGLYSSWYSYRLHAG